MDAGKIFVGGLSWQTAEEALRFHFEQYGTVLSVEVMRDRNTGDPRGFAFVVFSDPSTVDLVMDAGRHEINHKVVDVKRAQARGIAPPSIHNGPGAAPASQDKQEDTHNQSSGGVSAEQALAKVFVGGIPPHVDRDELVQIFSEFGPVTDAVVMVDQATQVST
jgi:RNA recognition motif-containing protein